jgi:hypothetical protein
MRMWSKWVPLTIIIFAAIFQAGRPPSINPRTYSGAKSERALLRARPLRQFLAARATAATPTIRGVVLQRFRSVPWLIAFDVSDGSCRLNCSGWNAHNREGN